MYAGKGDYNLKKAEERIWELRIGKGKRLVIEKVLGIELVVTGVISLLLFLVGWIGGGIYWLLDVMWLFDFFTKQNMAGILKNLETNYKISQ